MGIFKRCEAIREPERPQLGGHYTVRWACKPTKLGKRLGGIPVAGVEEWVVGVDSDGIIRTHSFTCKPEKVELVLDEIRVRKAARRFGRC